MPSIVAYYRRLSGAQVLLLIALFGALLTGAAFVIEHVFHAAPCSMCWWQRYTHWALFGGGALFFVMRRVVPACVGVMVLMALALVSGGIGLWQGLGQLGVAELPGCQAVDTAGLAQSGDDLLAALAHGIVIPPSCADVNFAFLGLSLAWWNVVAMGTMVIVCIGWFAAHRKHSA